MNETVEIVMEQLKCAVERTLITIQRLEGLSHQERRYLAFNYLGLVAGGSAAIINARDESMKDSSAEEQIIAALRLVEAEVREEAKWTH